MLRRSQPFKRDHLGRYQLGTRTGQPVEGGVAVAFAA